MNKIVLKAVGSSALIISVIVTLTAMFRAADWTFTPAMFFFGLWAISPYICLAAATLLLMRLTAVARMPLIFFITSAVMFVLTVGVYILLYDSRSSTYGLVFLFMPLWLHLGGFLMLGGGALLSRLVGAEAEKEI